MSLTPDEAGFTAFVAARGPSLQRAAFLLTGDHHSAQELVRAALMQAAKHWTKIHTSPEAHVRRSIFTSRTAARRRSRAVLVLRHWCGLTDVETADLLSLSVTAVQRIHDDALRDLDARPLDASAPTSAPELVALIGGHR